MNTTLQKNCVIECRVSSKGQAQGEGLESQEAANRMMAERLNANVRKVFTFGVSARTGSREDVRIILAYIKNSPVKIDYYIVRAINRFTRKGPIDYHKLKGLLARHNVQLIDSFGIIQPTRNALEHLDVEYEWSVSSPSEAAELWEAQRGSEELREMLIRMVGSAIQLTRKGYAIGTPLDGFINKKVYQDEDGMTKKRTIREPDPERAHFYKAMFDLRASGAYTDEEIVKKITAMGFVTKVRNRWNDDRENPRIIGTIGGRPLTVKEFQRIIRRPEYCGIRCNKWTKYQPVRAKYAGLVSIDIFNKANNGKIFIREYKDRTLEILHDYKRYKLVKRRNITNPLFPYKNIIVCPICSKRLLGSSPRGKSGKHFPTYHCARTHKYWGLPKKEIDEVVEIFIRRLRFTHKFRQRFEFHLLDKYRNKQKEILLSSSFMSNATGDLERKKALELDALVATRSDIVRTEIEQRIVSLGKQIETAQAEHKKLQIDENDIKTFVNYAKYLMEHLEELLISQDLHKQQLLFGLVFEKFPTYHEIRNGTPKLSWVFELSSDQHSPKSLVAGAASLGWNTIEETVLRWNYVFSIINLNGSFPDAL